MGQVKMIVRTSLLTQVAVSSRQVKGTAVLWEHYPCPMCKQTRNNTAEIKFRVVIHTKDRLLQLQSISH